MKKGFTLIEMLIVVAVLVTLMTMVFRLSSVGSTSAAKNTTIARLQRLENCLSGYYAAFGSYPPVKLHGTRNIYAKTSTHGIQSMNEGDQDNSSIWGWDPDKMRAGTASASDQTAEAAAWRQVNAACRSQPVDMAFPCTSQMAEIFEALSDGLKELANSDEYRETLERQGLYEMFNAGFTDSGNSDIIGRFNPYRDEAEWSDVQIFKFGLMSYLLPRYLVMVNGHDSFYRAYAQWTENNSAPRSPMDGRTRLDWVSDVKNQVEKYNRSDNPNPSDIIEVANLPSQAVCARWIPNLESMCAVGSGMELKLFGINVTDYSQSVLAYVGQGECLWMMKDLIFSPGSYDDDSTSYQYVLDNVTVKDGWWNTVYYYSPPPYQSYVLWSAGPNGRTFPPWVPLDSSDLSSSARKCIGYWIEDDIVNLSN